MGGRGWPEYVYHARKRYISSEGWAGLWDDVTFDVHGDWDLIPGDGDIEKSWPVGYE